MLNFFRSHKEPARFPYSIEPHCHLLPGVDHGAKTVDSAFELIKDEHDMGVNHFILTPHVTEGTFENTPETLAAGFEKITKKVKEEGLNVGLRYSAEYRVDDYFLKQMKNKQLVPMPGNFILIENSHYQETIHLDETIYNLQSEGYRIIMAHPERYPYYKHNTQRMRYLHDLGVLFQINLLSLSGYHGAGPKEACNWLIENQMIDLLASDMHHYSHVEVLKEYLTSRDWKKLSLRITPYLQNDIIFPE